MTQHNPFLGKKVLVVTAHPDDESPLAGGTIRQVSDSGGEVHLVCATLGEKGRAYVSEHYTEEELKEVRRKELLAAGDVLGLSSVFFLNFPDGQLLPHALELQAQLSQVISKLNPEVLMSFGPDGYTGHTDHQTIYAICKSISTEILLPFAMFCLPPAPYRQECQEVLFKKRKFGAYSQSQTCAESNIKIAVNGEQKLRALECHVTQFAGLNPYSLFSPNLARHVLSFEYFYLREHGH